MPNIIVPICVNKTVGYDCPKKSSSISSILYVKRDKTSLTYSMSYNIVGLIRVVILLGTDPDGDFSSSPD